LINVRSSANRGIVVGVVVGVVIGVCIDIRVVIG
jgi:F0F1-type ATP synthase assembly protein I